MANITYDYKKLTLALSIINQYEAHKGSVLVHPHLLVFDIMNMFIRQLKDYLETEQYSFTKQDQIDVFRLLADIAFDKLEKDVMGVN
jgi:hypothetical protein